ncbi:MAG: iron transporter [Propionibacteriaceae bacterium]|jgi:uncharacterized protein involved in high-affinity Fe2+ transport|nr:iron transporter [Propionibacteriaceae bacterium]
MKLRFPIALASAAILALAGCATDPEPASNPSAAASEDGGAAPAPGDAENSFTEISLGEPVVADDWVNIAGVYFQPVEMTPAMDPKPADADMHLEADITALAGNEMGFGAGDWIPNLTVDYEITGGNLKAPKTGTFMAMQANDGPHYGNNIVIGNKKGEAGTYHIKFIVKAPGMNHMVHTDAETGVTGRFWETPLTAEWDLDFVPREW